MGTDTPLAVLSNKPQPLYNYFKQLFAQVTNPPIDPIREELVTSTETTIGAEHNLFEESARHCRQLQLKQPILTNEELERIKRLAQSRVCARSRCPTLYRVDDGEDGLRSALETLCRSASDAIEYGYTIIVLSDRGVNAEYARDSGAARDRRRASPSDSRRARARERASSSSRANRARRCISACWSATARARSIRISRTRRWPG